jgi:hypothetical protein
VPMMAWKNFEQLRYLMRSLHWKMVILMLPGLPL